MSTSESNSLTQDSNLASRDAYFASPELSQRADLLRHLTENSNLIPLIRGVEGMGKTTFIQNLLDLAPENWIPVKIDADVMLQPDALLAYLAGLFDQNDRSERLFDHLILYFEDLRQDGFLPVIIVDDAHLLPEASVITLLRLHERSTDENPLAQILLFAEPEIDELLKTPQLRVMNLQSLQLLDMPEFTLEQTGLFLEHLLSSDGTSSIDSLTDSQIEMIHCETGGSPGLIREHAKGLIAPTNKEETANVQQGKSHGITMLGGGVLIIVVLLILIFQDDINSQFTGESETADVLQSKPAEPDGYKPLAIPDSEQTAISEQDEVVPVNQALQSDIESTEGKDSDLGPVSEENSRELEQVIALSQEQTAQAPTAPSSVKEVVQLKKEEMSVVEKPALPEVKEEKPSIPLDQTTKKKGALSEKQPAKPLDKDAEVTKKNTEEKKIAPANPTAKQKKQPEVVQEKSDAIKQNARDIKPQINKPIKSVGVEKKPVPQPSKTIVKSVASKVRSKPKPVEITPPAPAQSGASSSPAPVEDRSMVLAKKEVSAISVSKKPAATAPKPAKVAVKQASNRLFREQWLLQQKQSSYTIQLVGFQDEQSIAKFVQRHSLSGVIAYYRTQLNGKSWYPVLYGVYSSRGRANAARSNLPESIIKTGPWVRTLGAVQKDIRAR